MTSRYGRPLEFAISIVPASADAELARALARRADELGLDLVGIQDHPYQVRFLDTWALLADLLARSELGLGAGAFWEAIGAMGGPVRSGREALEALEEAIGIIRAFWSGERAIAFEGRHYSVRGLHPGPPPAHPIGIWLGVGKPRALALTGRLADGWVPSLFWATPELVPAMMRRVDEGAAAAERDPSAIRRVYNIGGTIADGPPTGLLNGPPEHWIETLTGFAEELGFDTFVFWPDEQPLAQLERFAMEVVPALRRVQAR